MKIGITGHQELADPAWVEQQIRSVFQPYSFPLIGVSSLAIGADQIFAQAILDSGGALEIVVPFDDYADVFKASGRKEYDRLLGSASTVEVLPKTGSHEEAYFAAGKRVVDISDLLIAVWNAKPAGGLGGTADVVQYAISQGKSYIHINPLSQEISTHMCAQ